MSITNLDSLNPFPEGGGGGSVDLTPLENKITNLSNITVKNNLSNQVLPQQKINAAPTDNQHIVRLEDMKYKQLVATSTQLNANTVSSGWAYEFEAQTPYSFIVRFGVVGVSADFICKTTLYLHNPNYFNNGAVYSFVSNETNLTEDVKLRLWVKNKKVYIMCNKNIKPINVFVKKEYK